MSCNGGKSNYGVILQACAGRAAKDYWRRTGYSVFPVAPSR